MLEASDRFIRGLLACDKIVLALLVFLEQN